MTNEELRALPERQDYEVVLENRVAVRRRLPMKKYEQADAPSSRKEQALG